MSRLVEELGRAGLVARRAKPDDRRAILVEATPRGVQLLEEGRKLRVLVLAERLQSLTGAELSTLARAVALLERLLIESPRAH